MGDLVLAAIVKAAVDVTGAAAGWIVGVDTDGERLVVSAVAGGTPDDLVGTSLAAGNGPAGYVLSSGQPLALSGGGDDPRTSGGLAAALGRPPGSVLCVPCDGGVTVASDDVAGALELIDKAGGGSFSFDDVELATLLAGIAGVAIAAQAAGAGAAAPAAPSPSELAAALARMAADDPGRYPAVAAAVATLAGG